MNREFDVVILTESRYLNPKKVNEYVQNILDEDRILKEALEARGLQVARKDWADPEFNWSSTRSAIFRTTWDYFDRFDEFKLWLDEVSQKTLLINSAEQIRWNMDKHYVKDLGDQGIRVVETEYIKRGETRSLQAVIGETGWKDVILKPTVAGAARHTYKLNPDNIGEYEDIFSELIKNEDMMIQPFQFNIARKGEVSFILIGGRFTHAILKKAKSGDFRVQDDFGGTVHHYEASEQEINFAEEVAVACDPLPAYARVDVMWDNEDQLAVSEVELIEPELWFREYTQAAELLAEEVEKLIGK